METSFTRFRPVRHLRTIAPAERHDMSRSSLPNLPIPKEGVVLRLAATDSRNCLFVLLDPEGDEYGVPNKSTRLYFGQPGNPTAEPPLPSSFGHVPTKLTVAHNGDAIEYRIMPKDLPGHKPLRDGGNETLTAALVLRPIPRNEGQPPSAQQYAVSWRAHSSKLDADEELTLLPDAEPKDGLLHVNWPAS